MSDKRNQLSSKSMRPGTVVSRNGHKRRLRVRKDDDSGWWLDADSSGLSMGGLADWVLEADWTMLSGPEGDETDGS